MRRTCSPMIGLVWYGRRHSNRYTRYEFQYPPGITDLLMERILVTELYCISSCSWNSSWRAHAFRTALLRRPAKSKQCVAATVMVMCAFCSYTVQNRSLLVDGIAIMVWLRLNWNFYSALPSTILSCCHATLLRILLPFPFPAPPPPSLRRNSFCCRARKWRVGKSGWGLEMKQLSRGNPAFHFGERVRRNMK